MLSARSIGRWLTVDSFFVSSNLCLTDGQGQDNVYRFPVLLSGTIHNFPLLVITMP